MEDHRKVIVILENAQLETVKVNKKVSSSTSSLSDYQLLNCDDHIAICRKHKRDPADCRPDITHQCLLTLLDSPLNKAGRLQVYIHTNKNVLIEINPHTRIPRTFKRFSGLMVQLLHKLSIRASNGPEKLLTVIKNPITDHLPPNCLKIQAEYKENGAVKLRDFALTLPKNEPIVFIVGAFAHGDVNVDYADKQVCISEYPLSASVACGKICNSFEDLWDII